MVRPKKQLGQHFLKDESVCRRIRDKVATLQPTSVLEIGPGEGVLTKYLLDLDCPVRVVEIDGESVDHLHQVMPELEVIHGDVLRLDITQYLEGERPVVVGNFPYNISSQIVFRLLDHRDKVHAMVGMFQKEVSERFCASEGSKIYGIPSVLAALFYERQYMFTVPPEAFRPPPKVDSGVMYMVRNGRSMTDEQYRALQRIVKAAFNLRRKKLSNSLKSIGMVPRAELADKRPEQITPLDFLSLLEQEDRS